MRIVVWNCGMALHAKYERLMALQPDIAIVPECAEPDILRRLAPDFRFADCEWRGALSTKGLGVFTFGNLTTRLHQSWDPRFHVFLPIEVRGYAMLNLLAVWAFSERTQKVVPNSAATALAVEHYTHFLEGAPAIVAGDFNASVTWDSNPRYAKFSEVDTALENLGLTSAYHAFREQTMGHETDPTLWWRHDPEKAFHIDYIHVSKNWIPAIKSVCVGSASDWIKTSDHAPVTVTYDMPTRA